MKIDLSKVEIITLLSGLNALEKKAKEMDMSMTNEFGNLKNKLKSLT